MIYYVPCVPVSIGSSGSTSEDSALTSNYFDPSLGPFVGDVGTVGFYQIAELGAQATSDPA